MLNHYEILTITRDAPISVINAVYNAIKEKYSPSKFDGEKKLQFEKAIQRLDIAYTVLSDSSKRKEYDNSLN